MFHFIAGLRCLEACSDRFLTCNYYLLYIILHCSGDFIYICDSLIQMCFYTKARQFTVTDILLEEPNLKNELVSK